MVSFNMDSDDDRMYIPQVKVELKPMINQEFEKIDEVADFYNRYAKDAGFSTRCHSSRRSKDDTILTRKEHVCYKQGDSKVEGKKRKRGIPKVGCPAKIAAVLKKAISIFVEGHNHPLTSPGRVHLLRSHRKFSNVNKVLSEQLSLVNIPKHKQFNFLSVQAGGISNVGCLQRDLYNHGRDEREEKKGHDADLLYMHFQNEKEKNPSFVYTLEADEEKKVTRCFWADPISRRAYEFYGDVVIFDTTYNTNRYGLIFAPLSGINNHGQTIIYGCAFLSNESTDSFVWLFKEFLKAMAGNATENAPKMIITDQDPAMTKAISEVLPHTFHRYCSWHILDKFSEKLDTIKYRDYYSDFHNCIWNSRSTEEFDSTWSKVIEKSELSDNKWLKSIYKIRSTWIPVYVRHIFSAGMSSSQRAESQHSFFKSYVSGTNSLVEFMVQFNRALLHQRHYELEEDHRNIEEKAKTIMSLDVEDHMAVVYTRKLFYEVQAQLKQSFKYRRELIKESATECVIKVLRMNNDTSMPRELHYNKELDFASCSCKMFESEGLPCQHILAYLMKVQDVDKLPSQYILRRWTKVARQGIVLDSDGVEINDNKDVLSRRAKLFQYATDAINKAMVSEEASQLFMHSLDTFSENIKELVGNESGNTSIVLTKKSSVVEHNFNEPNQVRAKGCGRRLKKGKEKKKVKVHDNQGRKCHGCGLYNQLHDKRNCPVLEKLVEESSQSTPVGSSSTNMDVDNSSSERSLT